MYEDAIPVEAFVNECFQKPQITKITSAWRVEQGALEVISVNYLREMGINFVKRFQKKAAFETIVYCLKRSNEVKALVKKAESEENDRRRSRHADL